eukprot:848163_1
MQFTVLGGLIGLCIIGLFVIIVTYDILRKAYQLFSNKQDDLSAPTATDIRILIYINLLVILIQILSTTTSLMFSSSDYDCQIFNKISVLSFDSFRTLLYIIFLRRMIVIFDETIFALTTRRRYILYTLIVLYFVPYLTYIDINWSSIIHYQYDSQYACLITYTPFIFQFTSSMQHILIIAYSLYLFITPLHQLNQRQENSSVSSKLHRVMAKYVILHCTSICSCIVLTIVSYKWSFGYNYSICDAFINGFILILLHPIHNRLYKMLCCMFHSRCARVCERESTSVHSASNLAKRIQHTSANPAPPIANNEANQTPRDTRAAIELALQDLAAEMEQAPSIDGPKSVRDIKQFRVQSQFEAQKELKIKIEQLHANHGPGHGHISVDSSSPSAMNNIINATNKNAFGNAVGGHSCQDTVDNTVYLSAYNSKCSSQCNSMDMSATGTHLSQNSNNSMYDLNFSPPDNDTNVDLERKASNTLCLIKFESYRL